MTKAFDPHKPTTTFEHDSTLVVALELSGKSWELGAVVPGVERRPKRRMRPRDMADLLLTIERWRGEATRAGREVRRVVVTYEAGRDGFWIGRYLQERGLEVHIMQPASIAVERRARRVKTDRIDLDMLLRTLLAWLRGEPRVCTMVRIPSEAEEDQRRPGREREVLMRERLAIENRIENLLCLYGVAGFKPRLKKAAARLRELQTFAGAPLPAKAMAELERLMVRHRLASEQMAELEAARDQVAELAEPDRAERQIQLLVGVYGLGLETATQLVRELFCRPLRDRRAVAAFAGLAGTPFQSGGTEREQGIGKSGNPRVRRIIVQLAWRWLRLQPESYLSRWFAARTAGAKGRIRKIMIVAVARKLLVALWRYVETGVLPQDARVRVGLTAA
jgi:transposase